MKPNFSITHFSNLWIWIYYLFYFRKDLLHRTSACKVIWAHTENYNICQIRDSAP